MFARYDETGAQVGADTLVSSTAEPDPQFVRWNGSGYGITYIDAGVTPSGYYAAVDAAGILLGAPTKVTGSGDCFCTVTAAWNGSSWGITWANDISGANLVYFGRFDASGAPLAPDSFVTEPFAGRFARRPHVAWGEDRFGVAWSELRGGGEHLYFATLDANGSKISGDVLLFEGADAPLSPWLVWDGSRFVLAYVDGRSPNQVVYMQWVTSEGVPIGDPLPITGPSSNILGVAMVWTGASYAVVWDQDSSNIALAVITPD